VGYKINGKAVSEIPAHASGYDHIEGIYHTMPGWQTSTEQARQIEDLPKAAREYLAFVEKETGAKAGMISTGPDRNQTIVAEDFAHELQAMAEPKTSKRAI
jgi:adenylosuccinate synthase